MKNVMLFVFFFVFLFTLGQPKLTPTRMHRFVTPLLYLVLILPFFFVGEKRHDRKREYVILFVFYFLFDQMLTAMPLVFKELAIPQLNMNWSGKLLSYGLAVIFLLSYKRIPFAEYGFRWKQNEKSLTFSASVTIVITVLVTVYGVLFKYKSSVENVLFQLTMPSIVEEIVYRGILLTLLNYIFTRNWRWGETQFGPGAVVTSVLFGLWHGIFLTEEYTFNVNLVAFLYTALVGFVIALVRERTGSLVFPVIIHVLVNLLPNVIGMIV